MRAAVDELKFVQIALAEVAEAAGAKGSCAVITAEVDIAAPLTCACAGRLVALVESGMITQQQLRTSPRVTRVMSLTILFRELHALEIRFPIPTRFVGMGVWLEFMNLFYPYYSLR